MAIFTIRLHPLAWLVLVAAMLASAWLK